MTDDDLAQRIRQDIVAIDQAQHTIMATGNANQDQELRKNANEALEALKRALLARLDVWGNLKTPDDTIDP